jgi:phenylacetate-CoA ligase
MHASSGTTGSPTAVHYTRRDVNDWSSLMARCLHMAGVRSSDVFQNTSGYGLFTGGLGIHYGAELLGCLTIPAGAGNTRRQLKLIQDFGVTVIHIIPSYALYMGETLLQEKINPREFPVRAAIIGAEPHTEEARKRIEELLGCKCYNSYGLSEMNGPGVAFECLQQDGLHVWEDAYIMEIIDPDSGRELPEGERGELVMTTLNRTGMPILRYRTGDLTSILPGACACGRQHRRIDRITGRTDDMIILKGVNIYPMQIERVLLSFEPVGQNYIIEIDNEAGREVLRVKAEVADGFAGQAELTAAITRRLKDEILLTPQVLLTPAESLPKKEGKAVRVLDMRQARTGTEGKEQAPARPYSW